VVKNSLTFFFALLVGLAIQATVVHGLFPQAIAPDFLLILVLYLGVNFRSPFGAVGAFLLGLCADFATGKFVGPFAAGSVLAFALTVTLSNRVYAEKGFALVIIAFLACVVKGATYFIFEAIYPKIPLSSSVITTILAEAGITAILAPIIMRFLLWGRTHSFINTVPLSDSYRRA
jgi:rod shape-determining protein MreD